MSDFYPIPNRDVHGEFLQKVVDLLFKHVVFTTRQDKVVLWRNPEDLRQEFDFTLSQSGESQEKLLQLLKSTVKFSVKTGHPYFINQLFSGLDPYGLAGQWLTDALNASVYTYEVAPVFTLMEQFVIKEVCRMIGPQWCDGIFCPGGSFGNGMAINLARFNKFPEVKVDIIQGMNLKFPSIIIRLQQKLFEIGKPRQYLQPSWFNSPGRGDVALKMLNGKLTKGTTALPKLIIFVSEECHYSTYKFASLLGIGEENVVTVKTNEVGEIIPEYLEETIIGTIQNGTVPLMVIATLGTTVRGAFDPVNEISIICKKHNVWLHVDAAWGGGLLFSQKHRAKLNGIERANSIVINPHKLLAVPQQCSMLLVADSDILHRCHSRGAEYLFQKDKYYDPSYDVGDKYLQCGRKCDVFKFWLMWKAKGSSGFACHIDTLMEIAEYFEQQVNARTEFVLVSKRQYMNVCFWYLPRYLRGKLNISEFHAQLQKVAPQIKSIMVKHGSVMLNYQPLKSLPNFFRFVSQNSALTRKDVDFILDHIAEIGDALFK